jgi:ABC-2 type transport system ATP-binding protein
MPAIEVSHVRKAFADKTAVDNLSFTVERGEILGLIGPNGAGKTTTIRMVMDIIKPDSGEVRIFGEKSSAAVKRSLGYLPEERGLYRKLKVIDCIIYLSSLMGMDKRTIERRADELLAKTGMLPHKRRPIESLSKGMGQLIQFIVAVIHDPQLVILDEPFSGLDPVNAEQMKQLLGLLKSQKKAIILSTHNMNDVEELCDRVLMINNGQSILYGDLHEIRSRYEANSVLLDVDGETGSLPGVREVRTRKGCTELMLTGAASPQKILEILVSQGRTIRHFETASPSLNEIFLKVLEGSRA